MRADAPELRAARCALALACGLVLAAGCCVDRALHGSGTDGQSETEGSTNDDDLLAPDAQLEHGAVTLQLTRAWGVTVDPFEGTHSIEVTLTYLGCIAEFYADNPDYRQSGSLGPSTFGTADLGGEGWMDRLCADDDPEAAPCNVLEITQELGTDAGLTVVYEMTGEIEGRRLNFGPLPTPALTGCTDRGLQPMVWIAANGDIQGLDVEGGPSWVTVSYSPAKAAVGQLGPLKIHAGPPG